MARSNKVEKVNEITLANSKANGITIDIQDDILYLAIPLGKAARKTEKGNDAFGSTSGWSAINGYRTKDGKEVTINCAVVGRTPKEEKVPGFTRDLPDDLKAHIAKVLKERAKRK